MATEKLRRLENPTPLAEGEFWRISGIGEATQQRLHSAGIATFDQLASLSTDEIALILTGQVGVKERAARQDWTGQARQFAEIIEKDEKHKAEERKAEERKAEERIDAIDPAEQQHYESFLVEFLIEDENNIRRTRVTQVRRGVKASWAGWDSERFFDWIATQANLPIGIFSIAKPKPPAETPAPEQPADKLSSTIPSTNVTLSAKSSNHHKRFFEVGQPLELQLTLDLSKTRIADEIPLAYHATTEARNLQTGMLIRLVEIQGMCATAKQIALPIPIPGIAEEGTYSLAVAVQMTAPCDSSEADETDLHALCEAGLVHIYARDMVPAA